MPISDALIIGEDWISEHYFTTDATTESFQGRVLERRKRWDGETDSTRARFTAARQRLLSALIQVCGGDDTTTTTELVYADLLSVLGFTPPEFTLTRESDSPVTTVGLPAMPGAAALVVVFAKPVDTVDELLARHADTLLTPWQRPRHDHGGKTDTITSVSVTLSSLLTDRDSAQFALVVAGRWCLITDRERWPEGRWLAVDLQLVAERNDTRGAGRSTAR